jgi:predicted HicB family RNase H-like nuclease
MDILKYKDYEGTAELDMERGVCRGKVLFINDLVTYEAATPKELQHEFEAAVDDYLETCKEVGKEPDKTFKGLFNVRVKPELHRAAALYALAHGTSLNGVVECALEVFLGGHGEVTHNHKHTHTLTWKPTDKGEVATVQTVGSAEPSWSMASHVH